MIFNSIIIKFHLINLFFIITIIYFSNSLNSFLINYFITHYYLSNLHLIVNYCKLCLPFRIKFLFIHFIPKYKKYYTYFYKSNFLFS